MKATRDPQRDFKRILNCFECCENGISYEPADSAYIKYVLRLFPNLKPTNNRPDAYSITDNTLLLLEHFQFDNGSISRKGSKQITDQIAIDKKINKELLSGKDLVMVNQQTIRSGKLYIDNYMKQYNEHIANVDAYKLEMQIELKQQFDNILVGFVVEDVSPLGSSYFDGKWKGVDLTYTTEFLDAFEESSLDFVFAFMTDAGDNNIASFISKQSVLQHRAKSIKISSVNKFVFNNCIHTGFTIRF
ncbi:MAG: hypothetical protein E7338_03340 [Clostridiales bacterium]|nr:hypothetical protein [Clostridiales bacterium]